MKVVIADAHTPAALALIRELGSAGHYVWAVCEGDKKPLGLKSKYAAKTTHLMRGLSHTSMREALLTILHDKEKPLFIPLTRSTIDMVAKHKAYFDLESHTLVPPTDVLAVTYDKRKLLSIANGLGISVPSDRPFLENEPIHAYAKRQPLPIMLRYYDGEKLGLPPHRRYTIAYSEKELRHRYAIMHDVQAPVLVQDVMQGDCFVVGVVLDNASNPSLVTCHRRLRQLPLTGGPSTLCESVWMPSMVDATLMLLSHLKLTGLVFVEYWGTADKFVLTDVAPRAWGSLPLAYWSGASPGQAYMDAALQKQRQMGPYLQYETHKVMQYFAQDIKAGWHALRAGKPAPLVDVFRRALSPKVAGGIWDANDRAPVWSAIRK